MHPNSAHRHTEVLLNDFSSGSLAKPRQQRPSVMVKAASTDDLSTAQTAVLVSGAIFNPVVLYSEWTLFQTGKGLDPGPAGIYGALEGVGKSLT